MEFTFTDKAREHIEKKLSDRQEQGMFIFTMLHRG